MDILKSYYRKSQDFVYREIREDTVLVPLRQDATDLESIYTLNPLASWIWKQIDGKHTLEDILKRILLEYAVEPKEAESDLLDLIGKLKNIGAIVKVK